MGIMDSEKRIDSDYVKRNLVESVVQAVNKRFHGYYAEDEVEARTHIQQLLEQFHGGGGTDKLLVGVGDSLTLHQVCAFDYLYPLQEEGLIEMVNPFERLEDGRFSEFRDQPNDWIPKDIYDSIHRRVWEKARKALLSDVFITGANAITKDGIIVSTDGVGNRLSAVIFGPYKVIMVVGRNKIVDGIPEAFNRIKNVAAPLNHYRHFSKHNVTNSKKEYGMNKLAQLPCVFKGYCVECGSPNCTRHATMILEKDTGGIFKDRIHVIIVNRDLGC